MSELYKQLTADFPAEALSKDTSRGFELTSIKAQYVVERLNDVFGPEGWKADYTVQLLDKEQGCIVKCVLIANANEGATLIQRSAFGGSEIKRNIGDTIKSAMTDSLSKAASHIGIGNDVFKGKVKIGASPAQTSDTPAKRTPRL
jgi:hypothetical protein